MDLRAQHLLRDLTPRVLSTLLRRYRDFAACEDAVQEALLAASRKWPAEGEPDNPHAWLVQVASRKITDEIRAETARRLRERLVVSLVPADEQIALAADELTPERDDSLELFWMSCHPSLSPTSQVALTLRAVGGLTTSEIARAFMVPEPTMAQRLSRAKETIRASGLRFAPPTPAEQKERLPTVLQVLYLVFNEGYAATSGESVHRNDLSAEAIRVTRLLAAAAKDEPEVQGLLALMLLTDARRDARTGPHGELVPLDEQDRSRWDRAAIAEGIAILDAMLAPGLLGPFRVQAAIAALHDEATSTETTDWAQIHALYGVLLSWSDNPMVHLSRAIALSMVKGPAEGLAALDELGNDPRIAGSHRLDAARAHLLERAGDRQGAVRHYERAANATSSTAERNYLLIRAARSGRSA
jgi:RNA polymerase sigma factor (sigma-70 family)